MKIHEALVQVMKDVGSVKKSERNQAQGYTFRGIDAVTSAVFPALVKHGVVVVPKVLDYKYGTVEIGQKRTPMGHVQLMVEFTFYGPEGDSLCALVAAESMDSGDKATSKAHSVALRTALLQTLCLPTDEVDPDASTYERSTPKPVVTDDVLDVQVARRELWTLCKDAGRSAKAEEQRFLRDIGVPVLKSDADTIYAYINGLADEIAAAKKDAQEGT